MIIPVLHTPAGNHVGLAAILLAERINVEIDTRIL